MSVAMEQFLRSWGARAATHALTHQLSIACCQAKSARHSESPLPDRFWRAY
jgi:hypothetical protein